MKAYLRYIIPVKLMYKTTSFMNYECQFVKHNVLHLSLIKFLKIDVVNAIRQSDILVKCP